MSGDETPSASREADAREVSFHGGEVSFHGCLVSFHKGEGCAHALDCAHLARTFAQLVPHFPRPLARVDALLVGDAAMDAAHQRFSHVAGTTDVLSFPAHADDASAVEVDLIICSDVAARESAARASPIEREILLYAVHGTLHACGFRDDSSDGARVMHEHEDRILSAGGVGVVYASPLATPPQRPPPPETPIV